MLPMPYRRKELEPLLAHGQAKGIVCLAGLEGYDIAAVMEDVRAAVPPLEAVIAFGDTTPAGSVAFDRLAAAAIGSIPDPPNADDPAVLTFTSGTSAAPKAIVHAHRTFCGA